MTSQTNLWNLQGQLFELLEERDAISERLTSQTELIRAFGADSKPEYAEDLANIQAELVAIEKAIVAFILEKVKQVDEIRAPLLAMKDAAAICRAEAARADNQALAWERKFDTLKDLIKLCMKHLEDSGYWKPKETRKVFSPLGSFTLRGNGGKQPVEITNETLVPDEFCRFTLTVPGEFWNRFLISLAQTEDVPEEVFEALRVAARREVSKLSIEAELNRPCEECEGAGEKCCNPDHTRPTDCTDNCRTCRHCGGSGKRGVAGARLSERGESVIIK